MVFEGLSTKIGLTLALIVSLTGSVIAKDINITKPINSTNSTETKPLKPQSRIINGNTGDWSQFPSLVSLRINGGHSCGGALLNPTTVLTASHCSEASASSATVWAYNGGSLQRRQWWPQQPQQQWWPQQQWRPQQPQPQQPQPQQPQPQQPQPQQPGQSQRNNGPDGPYTIHRVSQIIKHPNYQSGGYIKYDVAIWKLATPVSNRAFYQIDTQNLGSREGTSTRFGGWGRIDPNDPNKLASRLQQTNLPIYSFNSCNAAYGGLDQSHHLCAGYREGRVSVCMGDSGGPLLVGNVVVGVTSFVRDNFCLRENFPSVFARVSTYAQWIQQYVR